MDERPWPLHVHVGLWRVIARVRPARVATAPLVIPTYARRGGRPCAAGDRPAAGDTRCIPTPPGTAGAEQHDQTYQSVVLENDYLTLTFLPALGGRLISIFDKVARRKCCSAIR